MPELLLKLYILQREALENRRTAYGKDSWIIFDTEYATYSKIISVIESLME